MRRLISDFAGRAYHIVGNLMSWLNVFIISRETNELYGDITELLLHAFIGRSVPDACLWRCPLWFNWRFSLTSSVCELQPFSLFDHIIRPIIDLIVSLKQYIG